MPDKEVTAGEGDLRAEVDRLKGQLAEASLREEAGRRAAEAEHARLTYELGHRVRNTLSVVQALASQTMRGAASKEAALEDFGARIMALSRVNDAVLKESWTTATLRSVAESVLLPLGMAPERLTIEGPDVRIGASAALSFGMALQELASNAARFGAWSGESGRVRLGWTRDAAPGDGDLVLTWSETGGGLVEPPEKRGFGTRLIEQSLISAFGRDVVLDYPADGVTCRVRAPASKLAS